jgi:hypothetical protein
MLFADLETTRSILKIDAFWNISLKWSFSYMFVLVSVSVWQYSKQVKETEALALYSKIRSTLKFQFKFS